MDEKNLEQLKAFGYSAAQQVKYYTFDSALHSLNVFARKVTDYYDLAQKSCDDLIAQGLIDGSIKSFEDFTEAFRDIITMLFIETGCGIPQHLADCIRLFRKSYELSDNEKGILELMFSRNKLVHEYYNYEYMISEFLKYIENYSDGLLELCSHLNKIVDDHNLRENRIYKKNWWTLIR